MNAGRRLMVHLVNFTGEMTRPIRRVLPQRDIRITLPAAQSVSKAYTLMHPQNLTVQKVAGGRTQIVVPNLDEYEVVVVER